MLQVKYVNLVIITALQRALKVVRKTHDRKTIITILFLNKF